MYGFPSDQAFGDTWLATYNLIGGTEEEAQASRGTGLSRWVAKASKDSPSAP
jgi:hypothetical protein